MPKPCSFHPSAILEAPQRDSEQAHNTGLANGGRSLSRRYCGQRIREKMTKITRRMPSMAFGANAATRNGLPHIVKAPDHDSAE